VTNINSGKSIFGVLQVVEVNPQTDLRWEKFLAIHPNSLIYHLPVWLRVLEKVYDFKPVHLACEDADGQIRGILPLFHIQGFVTGRGLVSLPRTPVAGPLALDCEAYAALLKAAVHRIQGDRRARLRLTVPSANLDGLLEGVIGSPWELTFVKELPAQVKDLRFGSARNHARIKWAVNKSARLGVRVRSAETKTDLRAWYRLYLDTMRWHSVPPRPYRFFEVCWELLQPRGLLRLLLAEQCREDEYRLLAGSIFLTFGQSVLYAFNGRDPKALTLRPNDAIHWHAMHDACKEGLRRYDFGEVIEGNEGLAQYKAKWGAEASWLYRYYYPLPQNLEATDFKADGFPHQITRLVWRRLPTSITALIGSWIYKDF
jgi:hypothetical protein